MTREHFNVKSEIPWMSLVAIACLTGLAGCSSEAAERQVRAGTPSASMTLMIGHRHDRDHDDEGPHGGHLIELGHNHKFHAELVEDEKQHSVIVYILDGELAELPIDQPAVILSLTKHGKTSSFELRPAQADRGLPSARYESTDATLLRMFETAGDVEGKLRVTIGEVAYVGLLDHHDHHGHSH